MAALSGGHRVRVVERRARTGGALRTAAAGPAGSGWPCSPTGSRAECRRLGVHFDLSSAAGPGDLAEHAAGGGPVIVVHRVGPSGAAGLRRVGRSEARGRRARARRLRPPGRPGRRPGRRGRSGRRRRRHQRDRAPGGRRPRRWRSSRATSWPGPSSRWTGDLAPANTRLARAGVRIVKRSVVVAVGGGTRPGAGPLHGEGGRDRRRPSSSGGARAARRGVVRERARRLPAGGRRRRARTAYEAVLEGRRAALAIVGGPVSATGRYKLLFTPLALGPVVVRNRIVFSAHLTNYAEDGAAERAARRLLRGAGGRRGGAHHHRGALDPPDRLALREADPRLPSARSSRATGASPTRSTATTRRSSPRSTTTAGRARACTAGCRCGRPLRSPTRCSARSPRRSTGTRSPRSSTATPGWPATAREGGFDGVELQCSHSSIVRGFLSPATNRRTDEYGGSLENRSRLLLQICGRGARGDRAGPGPRRAALRRRADRGRHHASTTPWRSPRRVEATGHVDYINTSIGVATATLYMIEASMQVPPAYALWIASALRKAVSLPVVGVGRFKDPLQADRALSEGHADLIGVVRGPDRRRRLRPQGARRARVVDPQLPLVQPGVRGPDGAQPMARVHREPPRRARGPGVAAACPGAAGTWWWSAPERAACRPPSPRPGAGTRSTSTRRATSRAGRSGWRRPCPAAAELGDLVRNQLAEASRLGVRFHFSQRADADLVAASRRRRGRRRHRVGARSTVVGRPSDAGGRRPRRARGPGRPRRAGAGGRRARVPPGDERRRAAGRPGMRASRCVTPAMVVGQDLGHDPRPWRRGG